MTPKEAFERIETELTNYLGEGMQDERRTLNQALTELEELKRDVNRFIELWEQAKFGDGIDDVEAYEFTRLHIKLSKVGKG